MTANCDGGDSGFSTISRDAVAVHHGDAEMAQVLVLLDLREHDARALLLPLEVLDDRLQRALEDVVGEHHAAPCRAPTKCSASPSASAMPPGLLLVAVREQVDAVLVAVAEQPEELARVRPAGDEHQLVDARLDERLDRVGDHRPVVERQQVLVRDPRQRMEPRARAAGEDDALHAGDC